MMLDPLSSLQTGLIAHIQSLPNLIELLGSPVRIYDHLPPEPSYPYISLGHCQASQIGGLATDVTEIVTTLSIVSRFCGSEEVKSIVAALRLSLDQTDLSLIDQHLVSLRVSFVDVFRAADGRTYYGLMRLRCVIHEPSY